MLSYFNLPWSICEKVHEPHAQGRVEAQGGRLTHKLVYTGGNDLTDVGKNQSLEAFHKCWCIQVFGGNFGAWE